MKTHIYQILHELMDARSLKVAQVAKLCDLPDSTVRGIINRQQKTVELDVAFRLASGLGVTLEQLNGEQPLTFSSALAQNNDELQLLTLYRNHAPHQQKLLLSFLQAF